MNLDLTDDQRQMRDLVREFATKEVAPGAGERDAREEFPLEIVRRIGALGLFGVPIPAEFGGLGADALTWALVLEELGRVDSSVAVTLSVASGLAAGMVVRHGTEEQKRRWLPPVAAGDMLASFALTEPSGGSDVKALRTAATLENGTWTLEGSKSFITNSGTPLTGFLVVACRTDDPPHDVSTLIVPAGTEGLVVGPEYKKLGWRSTDTHEVVFRS
ncbi:MAG TPA: acyl-CoA dehydrogenase family protein, partial [Actinomycetota bacterium]